MSNRAPLTTEDTAGASAPLEPGSVVPGTTPGYWRLALSALSGVSAFGASLTAAADASAAKVLLALNKSDVGLSNVDNTSDANKPVSTAQAAADLLRVLKAGDTMTGDLKVVKANARVGIGTATPQAPLDVSWDQNNSYNTVGWFNIPLLNTGNRVLFGVGKSLVADGYGWMGYFYAASAADRALEWGHSGTTALLSLAKSGLFKIINNNLVLPKGSGFGIQVDSVGTPSWGWRDLTCAIDPKATGGGSPARTLYRGTIYAYAFVVNDVADFDGFHIPHDYVPGSDLYVHVHWSHNGTAISGTAAFEVTMSYAKGHNQANFSAEVTQTISVATPDIATVPQYRHRVDEVKASTAGGGAGLHNTTDIEVDGLLIGYIKLTSLPTITGGNLFIHTVDIHYQSSNMATKQRAPNFYT